MLFLDLLNPHVSPLLVLFLTIQSFASHSILALHFYLIVSLAIFVFGTLKPCPNLHRTRGIAHSRSRVSSLFNNSNIFYDSWPIYSVAKCIEFNSQSGPWARKPAPHTAPRLLLQEFILSTSRVGLCHSCPLLQVLDQVPH